MSRIVLLIAPGPFKPPKRRPLTKARKRRIWEFHNGCCRECGYDVEIEGKGVEYDHRVPLAMGGADDDGPNMGPLCQRCHKNKTAGDLHCIARAKRIGRKNDGTWKGSGRKLKGRGFDKTKSRKMDGSVTCRDR